MSTIRVMIVDDHTVVRDGVATMLGRQPDISVVGEAANGQEAVDIFNEHGDSIDCVLLDYSMPRLSGMEVREELHAQHSELPIILMSGFSAQDIESRVTTPGAITILEKPVEHETVLEAIHDAIGAPA